jgi:membrane associated rhomboid family serine protease
MDGMDGTEAARCNGGRPAAYSAWLGERMIPFADANPIRRVPWMTLLLSALCIIVYFAVQPTGTPELHWDGIIERGVEGDLRFAVDNAAIPCEITQGRPLTEDEFRETFRDFSNDFSACSDRDGPAHSPGKNVWLALIATMFLHGSIPHLFGNLVFLWVFGNNLEAHKGWWRYLLLYLIGGTAATAAHVVLFPNSTVPMVGASGAIAAVMGAYFVLWPNVRIKSIIPIGLVFLRKVQAIWLLVIWLALNLLYIGGESSVAWAAHLGGFAFGALVGLWWRHQDGRRPTPATMPPPPELSAPSAPAPV